MWLHIYLSIRTFIFCSKTFFTGSHFIPYNKASLISIIKAFSYLNYQASVRNKEETYKGSFRYLKCIKSSLNITRYVFRIILWSFILQGHVIFQHLFSKFANVLSDVYKRTTSFYFIFYFYKLWLCLFLLAIINSK